MGSEKNSTIQNQIIEAFEFRHACKVMDSDKKIPDNEFQIILDSARLSPSSFGFEPWKFLVVQSRELRERLLPVVWGAQNTLPTASHFIIALARTGQTMRYDRDYIQHMMADVHHLPEEVVAKRGQFYQAFQKEDFNLLESDRAIFDWASKQTYIALANMMTSAALMKIDSCPIEGFKQAETNALLAAEFGVDTSEYQVAFMLALGYRVNEQPVKTRQSKDEIIQWL
ncbi:MAG: hypothetical protein ISEC1_P2024 [Thiomicrorhabdus sp.]|nr:MAG: hypothetical protein ISEC1_P2024 [Thiomicrorhabdus sp.]